MTIEQLKLINAINILAVGKIDALQNIHDHFNGDWALAWNSDLSRFLPKERDVEGKLAKIDYRKLKKSIDPDQGLTKLIKQKIDLISILDDSYPELLRHIPHPPFLLYVRGSHDVWRNNCFAVVGTRALSEYGKRATPKISTDLARAGFTIVSGLAAGIDTLAHKSALDAGTKTIAVLGCGIDDKTIFPVQNLGLAREIIENGGALLSEYPIGANGTKFSFPQRNRIISGLSRGVLVVEADEISGAMITAKCAIDQNRDVFAVPGNIFAKTSEGANILIKRGAKAVFSADDILEDYEMYLKKEKKEIKADNEFEAQILAVLSGEPMTPDEIIRKTGLSPAQNNATLMMMELNRKVKNLNGRFVLDK